MAKRFMQIILVIAFISLVAAVIGSRPAKKKIDQNVQNIKPEKPAIPFYIFKDSKAMTSIVLPENPSMWIKKSVEQFQKDLQDGYKVEIPVGVDSKLPGQIKLVVEKRTLETEDSTVISFPAEKVMEISGGETGVRTALFHLLEEFGGIRYLYQGGQYGTHYPEITELVVPGKTIKRNSAYPLGRLTARTNYMVGTHGRPDLPPHRRYLWSWEVRLGAKGPVYFNHALTALPEPPVKEGRIKGEIAFPLRDYNSGKRKVSEKVFPILHGKRYLPYKKFKGKHAPNAWQPCFTAQESVDEAVDNILTFLRKNPDTVSLPLGVNDNGNHCQCKPCVEMDKIGGNTNTQGYFNRSESYYRWVNKVVSKVNKEFPDLVFGLIAYREVLAPPTVKLHKAVVPVLCFDFNAVIDKDVEKLRKDLIKRWSEKAENLGFWAYDQGFFGFTLPRIYFKEQQKMIKFYGDHKGKFGFSSGGHFFTLTEGPKAYLHFKLTENPDLDLEELLIDWCEAAVGKEAAPYLREYYAFWEDFWRTKAIKTPWWNSKNNVYMTIKSYGSYMYGLEPGDMQKCRTLLEKVVELAEKSGIETQKKRAAVIMRIFEWYEAAARVCVAEFRSPDGTVSNAEKAVQLVRSIPLAVKSYELWKKIPQEISGWHAWKIIFKKTDPGIISDTLMTAIDFKDDKNVKAEIEKLAASKDVTSDIRFVAGLMLKGADSADSGNKVKDSSFEKSDDIGFKLRFDIHGKISREKGTAATGDYAVKMVADHKNFSTERIVKGLKKGASHYFAARFYVPKDQKANLEGRLLLWGNPTDILDKNRTWPAKINEIVLSSGKWNYVSAMVPAHSDAVGSKLCIRLKNFERGAVVYMDDVQLIEIPEK
ncbi:MAG: DUF4838 domain-containing protein [Planctomycetota bacterium]|jgi:hypothetical protein